MSIVAVSANVKTLDDKLTCFVREPNLSVPQRETRKKAKGTKPLFSAHEFVVCGKMDASAVRYVFNGTTRVVRDGQQLVLPEKEVRFVDARLHGLFTRVAGEAGLGTSEAAVKVLNGKTDELQRKIDSLGDKLLKSEHEQSLLQNQLADEQTQRAMAVGVIEQLRTELARAQAELKAYQKGPTVPPPPPHDKEKK